MPDAKGRRTTALSDREFEVFRLLVAGRHGHGDRRRLNLSVKTVSTHKARMMEKMGMDNQADLVRYAMRHRLRRRQGARRANTPLRPHGISAP